MDERDYKAMNEELKSADEILGKNTGMTFDEETYLIQTHFEYVIKSMEEYASQFQKQLKEKDEEIERLRSSLFTSERFRMEDAATSIDDRNILHAQLTKSNEMNENIGVLLRNANDNSDRLEKWGNELNEKLKRAISAMTKTVQTLSFHGLKSNELNDFLTEYQNSKK